MPFSGMAYIPTIRTDSGVRKTGFRDFPCPGEQGELRASPPSLGAFESGRRTELDRCVGAESLRGSEPSGTSPKVALQEALAEHIIARCAALSEPTPMKPGQLEALSSPGTVAATDSPEGRLWSSIHALPALREDELCGLPVGAVLAVKDVWENGTTQSVQLLELTSLPTAFEDWSLSSSLKKDSYGCYVEEATTCFRFPRQVGVFLTKDGPEVSSALPLPGHFEPSYPAGKALYFLASRELLGEALALNERSTGS